MRPEIQLPPMPKSFRIMFGLVGGFIVLVFAFVVGTIA